MIDFETPANGDFLQIPPGWRLDLTADGQSVSPHQGKKMAGIVSQSQADDGDLLTRPITIPNSCQRPLARFWFWHDFGLQHQGWTYVTLGNTNPSTDTRNVIDSKALGWTQSVLDLRQWVGMQVSLMFEMQFQSGDSTPAHWYLDDISFECQQTLWNPESHTETFDAGFGDWSAPNGLWYVDSECRFHTDCQGASSNMVAGLVNDGDHTGLQTPTLYSPYFQLAAPCAGCSVRFRAWFNIVDKVDVYTELVSADGATMFAEEDWTGSSGWQDKSLSADTVPVNTDVQMRLLFRKESDATAGSVVMIDDVSLYRP